MSVSYRAQTARVTGARHVRAGEMCQDAALCGVRGELAFYGLADGQSGARFGLEGAQAALTVIRDYIGRRGLTLLASYVYTDEIQYELAQLLRRELLHVLKSLTPREERVITLRFGLEDGRARTLEELGKEFNVTRERVRQIEAKALRKLRHPSRAKLLRDYLDE